LIGWRGATQEFGVLLFALTVRALLTRVSNTPSTDFCRALKPSHDAFSHERRASRSRNWAGQDSGPGSFPVATGREDWQPFGLQDRAQCPGLEVARTSYSRASTASTAPTAVCAAATDQEPAWPRASGRS